MATRSPPHSRDAEASVLGGVLLRNDALFRVDDLSAEDFYDAKHAIVFSVMRDLETLGKPIDPVTLENRLQEIGKLEKIGGVSFLSDLALRVPTADNIEHYRDIVREKKLMRDLIVAATEICQQGLADAGDVEAYFDEAEAKIFRITQRTRKDGPEPVAPLIKGMFRTLQARTQVEGGILGVPTGFFDLDKITAGLHPTELIILAARPAMGKTSFALAVARHAAVARGFPVAIFSLEMSAEQLTERLLCIESQVDSTLLRQGKIVKGDMNHLMEAANRLAKAPIVIDDTPALSLREIRSRVRRTMSETKDFGLVIVDYLQLLQGSDRRRSSREQEISEISRGLKSLAKEVKCPVLALSQLNRSLESRDNKRPHLSDLRESGAIEQDADLVCFLYRHEVYYPDDVDQRGVAEIILGKNRHGPTDTVRARFEGKYTRFSNLSSRPKNEGF